MCGGFVGPGGEGPDFVKSGASRLGGELPVNTSGRLKSCGHPIGAKRALGHTLGGPGAVSSVFVLSKN